jgi:hypothetical protein
MNQPYLSISKISIFISYFSIWDKSSLVLPPPMAFHLSTSSSWGILHPSTILHCHQLFVLNYLTSCSWGDGQHSLRLLVSCIMCIRLYYKLLFCADGWLSSHVLFLIWTLPLLPFVSFYCLMASLDGYWPSLPLILVVILSLAFF